MIDKDEKSGSRITSQGFQDLFSGGDRSSSRKERERNAAPVSMEQDGLAQSLWLKSLEDKAREEGYRVGYRDGFAKGQEDAAEIRDALEAWSDLLPRLLGEELEKKTDILSSVVLSAVTRLLGDNLVRPEGVRFLVETLVAEWGRDQEADLFFSPEMFAWLESHLPDWFAGLADRKIRPGATGSLSGTDIRLSIRDQAVAFSLARALGDLETRLREVMAR